MIYYNNFLIDNLYMLVSEMNDVTAAAAIFLIYFVLHCYIWENWCRCPGVAPFIYHNSQ